MKRTLFFMLLSACLSAPAAWAYDFYTGGIYYYMTSSKTVEVTNKYPLGGNCYSGNVNIPATVTYEGSEYRVTAIGKWAFLDCTGLTSVTIGKSVQTIDLSAFYNCSGLRSVTIPNSVTSIGTNAFCSCSGLKSVTIPEGVRTIGNAAFDGCTGLTSVTIPKSVTAIGDAAFRGCTSLTSVTIPEGVRTIGHVAFGWCDGLTSVTIPESVQTIGNSAFGWCTGLKSVTAYNPELVDIDTYVFYYVDCTNCTLYVPAESVNAYKAAEGWKEFGTILPIDESSAITETEQEQTTEHIAVYNLQGVLVLETDDADDLKTLQNGAYIVNGKTMIIAR